MQKEPDKKNENTPGPLWPFVTLLAFAIPGAGHFYIGHRIRGIILCVAITVTFWAGIAFGGVMTVDSHYHPKWFSIQLLTGISGGVSWYRQHIIYEKLAEEIGVDISELVPGPTEKVNNIQKQVDDKLHQQGLALVTPAEDTARIFTGTAGMMNLLVMFDFVMLCLIKRSNGNSDDTDKKKSGRKENK